MANNRLTGLPAFLGNMRAPANGVGFGVNSCVLVLSNHMYASLQHSEIVYKENNQNIDQNYLNPPLTKVNLRSNQLRGSIILGNYGVSWWTYFVIYLDIINDLCFKYLNNLDVSENDIEILDLSALDQLETLQCSRNKIREIILNGRVLRSVIAGNNGW